MTQQDQVMELTQREGLLRYRDAITHGISPSTLHRMVARGLLEKHARGLYGLPEFEPGAHHTLALVTQKIPHAVICLLSALRVHELGEESPHRVWIAIEEGRHRPTLSDLPLHIVSRAPHTLQGGVERRCVEGAQLAITTPAQTVADCYRFRHLVGLDVANTALRDFLHTHPSRREDLVEAARRNRVLHLIRPRMEMCP